MELLQSLRCVVQGMVDAFAWHIAVLTLMRSDKIKRRTLDCVVLNGIIFLGSLALFNFMILPMFNWLLSDPFVVFSKPTSLATMADAANLHGTAEETVTSPLVQRFFDTFLFALYHIFWVFPIYCLSFILNGIWHQEIADEAFAEMQQRRVVLQATYDGIVRRIVDEIHRMILFVFFLVQATAVYLVPLLGPIASFLCITWLYAFYCFEYKWINKGWSLERRLDYLERHWAYFAGFGFPFTLFTVNFPQFVSGGVFALLFPMYIIMAMSAVPQPAEDHRDFGNEYVPERIPIFSISRRAAVLLTRYLRLNESASRTTTGAAPNRRTPATTTTSARK